MGSIFTRRKSARVLTSGSILTPDRLLENIIQDYTMRKSAVLIQLRKGAISKEAFLADVRSHIQKLYSQDIGIIENVMVEFEQFIFGYSKVTPLIENPEITDIHCYSFDNIRVKIKGVEVGSDVKFNSKEEFRKFVEYVATKNMVGVSNVTALQRFTDIGSNEKFILRFTTMMPLVATYGEPYLIIRKIPKDFPEVKDLVDVGLIPNKGVADDLVKRFSAGSTLICGGGAAGKTTLMNALKETLPTDCSTLVIQEADELMNKTHPAMMFLHSLPDSGESAVTYDLQKLSIAGLTADIKYFIIGEIKGAEAMYILNAAYTGQICAATIHAPSARTACDKLVDYAMYNSKYSRRELMKMMATCWKTTVYMDGYRIKEVYNVDGWDESTGEIEYSKIYEF